MLHSAASEMAFFASATSMHLLKVLALPGETYSEYIATEVRSLQSQHGVVDSPLSQMPILTRTTTL
jgi:hypothetical protein